MKGVDLSIFQFDWNAQMYVFFMNADGTIYARYGSTDSRLLSTVAFRRTMERVLEVHAKSDRDAFKGKRGPALKWATPEATPYLASRVGDNPPPRSCIHCHHVWTAVVRSMIDDGQTIPSNYVWRYPPPEAIGVTLSRDDGSRIAAVKEGSQAAKAGAREGDVIEAAAGQAIFTPFDLEWALQGAPDKGEFELRLRRGEERVTLKLALDDGWRRAARRPIMGALGLGMRLDVLSADARKDASIADGKLAIRVVTVGKSGAAKDAGFKSGDIIVSLDGQEAAMADDELIARIRGKYKQGSKITFGVLRGGEKTEIWYEVK